MNQLVQQPGTHKCQTCWRQWGITRWVRSDRDCALHHDLKLCQVHGGIDCFDGKDGCTGSLPGRRKED